MANARLTAFVRAIGGVPETFSREPDEYAALFEAVGDAATKLTIGGDFVGIDDPMVAQLRPMIERSAATIKSLIEAET